jgi:hypothetical protein
MTTVLNIVNAIHNTKKEIDSLKENKEQLLNLLKDNNLMIVSENLKEELDEKILSLEQKLEKLNKELLYKNSQKEIEKNEKQKEYDRAQTLKFLESFRNTIKQLKVESIDSKPIFVHEGNKFEFFVKQLGTFTETIQHDENSWGLCSSNCAGCVSSRYPRNKHVMTFNELQKNLKNGYFQMEKNMDGSIMIYITSISNYCFADTRSSTICYAIPL